MTQKHPPALILIGHGGPASDTPRPLIEKLKRLEAQRRRTDPSEISAEEAEVDRQVRTWPRTPKNDPYKSGLESIAGQLQNRLPETKVVTAYNEFCAPSIEEAVESLIADGLTEITLATTMFTRGGSHADCEIPYEVGQLQKRHPGVRLRYAWPFDEALVADFLIRHLESDRCASTV